jgi:pyridoxine 5'-phosphate synthase PdxJ
VQLAVSAAPYQALRKAQPELGFALPAYFAPLQFRGLAYLSVAWDPELRDEITALRRYLHLPLDVQVGTTPDYMREVLSLEPPLVTFANLQRADNCLDLLLFAEQLRELLASFPLTRTAMKVRLEPDLDQLKAASKLGFHLIELDTAGLLRGTVPAEKMADCLKTAEKLSIRVVLGAEASLPQIPTLLRLRRPDIFCLGTPFFQVATMHGLARALDTFKETLLA